MEISEEVPLLEKHLVKRKMESQQCGEVRRIHVIYFLSRMGKAEHPHLIRVHHTNRAGVHLRDVKRWLSDMRGKEMPDSFSWSYKRRYKTGYVWQDLLDDDLITPISDNEYVLKGSEISAFPLDQCASPAKTPSIQKPDPIEDNKTLQCTTTGKNSEIGSDFSCKPNETVTEKKMKKTVTFKLEGEGGGRGEEYRLESEQPLIYDLKRGVNDSSFDTSPLQSDEVKNRKQGKRSFLKIKSASGPSQVLRNILKCRAVDAKDSALVAVNRDGKGTSNPTKKKEEICKAEILGGSQRGFGGTWNAQNARKSFNGTKSSHKKSAVGNQKPVFGTYKPIAEPNCSQCGKAFKPEKLHTHMKSCKAMKSRGGKGGPGGEKMPRTAKDELTTSTTTKESSLGFHLTHPLHQSYDK